MTTKIIQIAVSGNAESGESIYALTLDGSVYEQKSLYFRFKVNDKNEPDPKGEATRSKYFTHWERVPLNMAPMIPNEMLAAKWTSEHATP